MVGSRDAEVRGLTFSMPYQIRAKHNKAAGPMTEEDHELRTLRQCGVSYSKIARRMKLTREQVRLRCAYADAKARCWDAQSDLPIEQTNDFSNLLYVFRIYGCLKGRQ